MTLLTLFALWALAVAAHVFGLTLAALLVREPLREVGLFVGPRLFGTRRLGVALRVGLLPLGGWVTFRRETRDLPAVRAVFLAVAGPLALLGLGALSLGVPRAATEFGRGFGQAFLGALFPRAEGAPVWLALHDRVAGGGEVAALGLIAAKLAAFNLLPLPGLNGAVILDWVTRPLPLSRAARERGTALGLILLAVLLLGWGLAAWFALPALR